jgi:hypothetical protein
VFITINLRFLFLTLDSIGLHFGITRRWEAAWTRGGGLTWGAAPNRDDQ